MKKSSKKKVSQFFLSFGFLIDCRGSVADEYLTYTGSDP